MRAQEFITENVAISLSKLGKFHPGADPLAEFVPERAAAQYALHPDKWESTFYSLTNKDSDKLKYYGPKKISIPPGTLVGDMAIANKFYRAKTAEEKQQYAELYRQSLKPYPVDVSEYRMPELLIPHQGVAEAFNQPYATDLEKSEHDDYDSLVQLPDGSHLSVMFNNQGDGEYQVEFWRGPSQGVTGEGDAQRIFATVLSTIQRFIKEHNPWRLTFSATKDVEPGQNSESRAKLYNRLVDRYAAAWGYDALINDLGDQVEYELTRLKPGVTEDVMRGVIYTKPNLEHEWPEANRYPEFHKLGKDQWIKIARQGSMAKWSSLKDVGNFDSDLSNLEPEKIKRAAVQVNRGKVELPIVGRWPNGELDLIAGNTRTATLLDQGHDPKVWVVDVPDVDIKENFADGKKSEMNFEQGDCPIFAIALHRLSKLPLMALVEYDDEMGSAVLVHAYVKLNDKWRIDATGETDVDWMLQKYPNSGAAEEIEISERDLIKLGYGKNKCPTLQQVLPHAKEVLQDIELNENFADGKVKGKSRPGRVKRAGASCAGSVSSLRAKAKRSGGERGKMYHWCANMKSGKKK
jgi:hypothetical protein